MPRPRLSRLVPPLASACEELLRHMTAEVEAAVHREQAELRAEIGRLRREVGELARALARTPAAPGRVGRPRTDRVCSVKGCVQPHVARGLCKNHYQQMRYLEKQAASGHTVRHRRGSSGLSALLEATKSGAHGTGHGSTPAAPTSPSDTPHESALRPQPIGRAQRA